MPQRAGKGSHGSVAKAGKVRGQTPKIKKTNLKKSPIPRIRGRRRYHYRVELKRKVGQDWFLIEKK